MADSYLRTGLASSGKKRTGWLGMVDEIKARADAELRVSEVRRKEDGARRER